VIAQEPPIDWVQTGVIGGIVLLVVWSGLKRKWLFYFQHDEAMAQKDKAIADKAEQIRLKTMESAEWKMIALKQAGILEQAVERTATIVTRAIVNDDPRVGGAGMDLPAGGDDAGNR
jgi:hypothetical protein